MTRVAESFRRDLADVNWRELRIHLQRDAIILVADELDLISVGVAVAEDNKKMVEKWIAASQLVKPNEQQLESWEREPETSFQMLIVQPFILIQSCHRA